MAQRRESVSHGPVSRRQFLRVTSLAALSVTALPLLQACAPAQQAPAAGAGGQSAAPGAKSLLKVRFLNTQGGLGDWAAYVGKEKKYFEEEGVDVELTPMGSQGAITNAIISGQADVATSSVPAAIAAVVQGAPMKLCMATQMATPQGKFNNWWCALPDAPFDKPADLKGKKIHIFAPNSLAQVSTRTILRQHGLQPGDYEEVAFTFDQAYTALKSNRVDVSFFIEPFFSNSNKLTQEEYGRPMKVVYDYLDLFPQGLHLAGMMANTNYMAQNAEAMRRLLRAYSRAAKWGNANPDELKQVIASYAGVPYENIKDMIPAEHSEDGTWLPGFLTELQKLMIAEKTVEGLTEPLPEDKIVETAYLPKA